MTTSVFPLQVSGLEFYPLIEDQLEIHLHQELVFGVYVLSFVFDVILGLNKLFQMCCLKFFCHFITLGQLC